VNSITNRTDALELLHSSMRRSDVDFPDQNKGKLSKR